MDKRYHLKQNVWESIYLIILTLQQPLSNKIISEIDLHLSPPQLIRFLWWLIYLLVSYVQYDEPTIYQPAIYSTINLPIYSLYAAWWAYLPAVCSAMSLPIYLLYAARWAYLVLYATRSAYLSTSCMQRDQPTHLPAVCGAISLPTYLLYAARSTYPPTVCSTINLPIYQLYTARSTYLSTMQHDQPIYLSTVCCAINLLIYKLYAVRIAYLFIYLLTLGSC